MRKIARDGGDPLEDRRKANLAVPTFSEASKLVHAEHKSTWKNAKHAAQWISTLKTYVMPLIGDRRIDQIETPDILRVSVAHMAHHAGNRETGSPAHRNGPRLGQGFRV